MKVLMYQNCACGDDEREIVIDDSEVRGGRLCVMPTCECGEEYGYAYEDIPPEIMTKAIANEEMAELNGDTVIVKFSEPLWAEIFFDGFYGAIAKYGDMKC